MANAGIAQLTSPPFPSLLVKRAKQCLATEGRPHKEFWLEQNFQSKNLVLTVDISVVCCLYAVMLGHFLGLRI